MSKRVKVHVGTLDDMGTRFVSAWHRLEGGEKVPTTRDISGFASTAQCTDAEAPGVAARRAPGASCLGKGPRRTARRDYKRVHEDVKH